MRVISGKYRGKKLIPPKDDQIRPTSDKAKESLFNMIQSYVYDCEFLDLFSGSGAVSIEAISRGARTVTLIENSKMSIKTIQGNLALVDYDENTVDLKNIDVISFLEKTDKKYDIIFADPPYSYKKINEIVKIISQRQILNKDGVMIIETDKNFEISIPENMFLEKQKIYSISKFSVISYNTNLL